MKKTMKILGSTMMVLALASYFSISYFFGKLDTTFAAYNKKDPLKLLVSPMGKARYAFLPNAQSFLEGLNKNKKIRSFISSVVGKNFLQAPPFKATGIISDLLNYIPNSLKSRAIFSLFSGSVYYSSSPDGFVFLFETNRAGKYILKRLRSKKFSIALKKNFFVLASSKYYLKKQLKHLNKQISGYPEKKYKENSLHVIIPSNSPNSNVKLVDKDIFFSLYNAFFPADLINYQSIRIFANQVGLTVMANARFNKSMASRIIKLHNETFSTKQKNLLSEYSPNNEIILQFHQDIQAIEGYISRTFKTPSSMAKVPSIIQFSGLMADYGLLIPKVAFYFSKKNRFITTFLQDSFKFKNYKETKFEKGSKIQRVRYSYYRGNSYYGFSPVQSAIDQDSMLWASSEQNYKKLKETVLASNKRIRNLKFVKFTARHPKISREKLFYSLSGDLYGTLKNISVALKKVNGRYNPASFDDFKDTLPKIAEAFSGSTIQARGFLSNTKLRSIIEFNL